MTGEPIPRDMVRKFLKVALTVPAHQTLVEIRFESGARFNWDGKGQAMSFSPVRCRVLTTELVGDAIVDREFEVKDDGTLVPHLSYEARHFEA